MLSAKQIKDFLSARGHEVSEGDQLSGTDSQTFEHVLSLEGVSPANVALSAMYPHLLGEKLAAELGAEGEAVPSEDDGDVVDTSAADAAAAAEKAEQERQAAEAAAKQAEKEAQAAQLRAAQVQDRSASEVTTDTGSKEVNDL